MYATTRAYCVWGGEECKSFPTQKTHWTLVNILRIVFVIFSLSLEIIGCGDGEITVFVFRLEQDDIYFLGGEGVHL